MNNDVYVDDSELDNIRGLSNSPTIHLQKERLQKKMEELSEATEELKAKHERSDSR
jgi:hypothetical protein